MLIIEFNIFDVPANPFDWFNLKLRGIFYIVYYLAINTLLFKKNITSFDNIPKFFLGTITALIIIMLISFTINSQPIDYSNKEQFQYASDVFNL